MNTAKSELRKYYAAARRNFPAAARGKADEKIAAALRTLLADAERIAGYCSDGAEPELEAVLRWALSAGKRVALPRFVSMERGYELAEVRDWERDLERGKYGISEPRAALAATADDERWDFLIPGLAFDAAGNRLGRGGGFYDRLLAGATGKKIGVFYHFQYSETMLPTAAHDRKLELAVTDKQQFRFTQTHKED